MADLRRHPLFRRQQRFMLFGLTEAERSSRGVVLLAALYLGALALAALVAPPIHRWIQWWHETSPSSFTEIFAGRIFPRTFDRLRWLPTLIAFPFLLRACGLLSWSALGVSIRGKGLREALAYFLAGVFLLALAGMAQGLHYGAGWVAELNAGRLAGLLLLALLSGILIGLLEEIVFRGMAFRMFYTWVGPVAAVLLTSLFFSYAHFKFPPELWDPAVDEASWWQGWRVAGWTLGGVWHTFDPVIFLNLTLFGIVLNLSVLRHGSLMPAIGFHAGVVAAIAAYTELTNVQELTRGLSMVSPFWGSGGMRDGLLTTAVFLIMVGWLLYGKRDTGTGGNPKRASRAG